MYSPDGGREMSSSLTAKVTLGSVERPGHLTPMYSKPSMGLPLTFNFITMMQLGIRKPICILISIKSQTNNNLSLFSQSYSSPFAATLVIIPSSIELSIAADVSRQITHRNVIDVTAFISSHRIVHDTTTARLSQISTDMPNDEKLYKRT